MTSSTILSSKLVIQHLGLVDYLPTWELQRSIQEKVIADEAPNTLLLLEHNSVYTAGRRTEEQDKPFDGTPVIATDREIGRAHV